ncbi:hypothetical protein THASP1DRAFT_17384 [Thamnocephalis sphaerospora]|uniref:RING-type E3 ubiquitin transferase n=1 Tax=Thamnocephalis sphaerospora TaxID=78915 RepID=A0A4P9XMS7_9FUNG|nr:hypothetical protein THASP1DRAFT_17384 [Thamnocephalis sphaerospora]|eukprot:RKP07224.1 hypothetical protein THASP1DRAFT_17384 [Thamnocephalis sphaerospora]
MRIGVYGAASTLLAAVMLQYVYARLGNFFAAGVYLAKSNACLLVLLNFGVFVTVVLGKGLQRVFFGPLRAVEVEHLYERSWFAVTETCLAMTVFRDTFDVPFLAAFAALLFVKIFHWLLQDRVEFMDQAAQLNTIFHARVAVLLSFLWAADAMFIVHAMRVTLRDGPGTWLLFGFEYTILACTVVAVAGRYLLNLAESRMGDEPWEEKSVYLFYLELAIDFVKLTAYVSFFLLLLMLHGLPLHIIRDLYVTARSFFRRCGDLRRYRRATRDMEQRYPTLDHADLAAMADSVCVVCREDMTLPPVPDAAGPNARQEARANEPHARHHHLPKRLPCGHAFHFRCLRSWLERQQSCPTWYVCIAGISM